MLFASLHAAAPHEGRGKLHATSANPLPVLGWRAIGQFGMRAAMTKRRIVDARHSAAVATRRRQQAN
jgi:hypothetical protein